MSLQKSTKSGRETVGENRTSNAIVMQATGKIGKSRMRTQCERNATLNLNLNLSKNLQKGFSHSAGAQKKNIRVSSLAHYPVFERRPDDTYLQQWREHIKQTGSPETFDYVTMTGPRDVDGAVLMSGEIEVPIDKREDEAMVPCPLCRPNSPKFKTGRMAWFPTEKTVLFIGNKCAKRHMGDEYEVADRRFKKEVAAKAMELVWAEVQARSSELIEFGSKMLPVSAALEKAKKSFGEQAPQFDDFLDRELFHNRGVIEKTINTGFKDQRDRFVYETVRLGTLVGRQFLSRFNSQRALKNAISVLEATNQPLPKWSHDDPNQNRLDDTLAAGRKAVKAIHILRDIRDYLASARAFVEPNNLALLQLWADDVDESPFDALSVRRKGGWLFFSVSAYFGSESAAVQINPDLFNPLPSLETIKFDLPSYPFVSRISETIE